jgi:NAD(P)-dependent dehydrogenase (short-subunit alcohol dehydrogenase family)
MTLTEVAVVTGLGGMGDAVARRLTPGRIVVLADVDPATVDATVAAFEARGHTAVGHRVDVSDARSVAGLADAAAALGPVRAVVHTAGVSPVQASSHTIVAVDLLGTALVLAALGRVIAPGGAGVVIASMAAHTAVPIAPEDEGALALSPVDALGSLACVAAMRDADPGVAYGFAKRANHLRVRAESVAWGRRGARLNSISPGVITTPMGRAELDGPHGDVMRAMIAGSGTGRAGTAEEIAAVVEFLLSPAAAFVTGTDLLVDGGVVAALTTGQIAFG